jgi:hypothetical protein
VKSVRVYRPAERTIRGVEPLRVNKETAILTYVYSVNLLTPTGKLDSVRKERRISKCWAQCDGGWVLAFVQDFVLTRSK